MNSFYHRFRQEKDIKRNEALLERMGQHIRRAEKILAGREFPSWPYMQSVIKEKIDRLESQLENYSHLSEVELKLALKEKEDLTHFHDFFDELERDLQYLKSEYERIETKLKAETPLSIS